jgi:hypothetical protein
MIAVARVESDGPLFQPPPVKTPLAPRAPADSQLLFEAPTLVPIPHLPKAEPLPAEADQQFGGSVLQLEAAATTSERQPDPVVEPALKPSPMSVARMSIIEDYSNSSSELSRGNPLRSRKFHVPSPSPASTPPASESGELRIAQAEHPQHSDSSATTEQLPPGGSDTKTPPTASTDAPADDKSKKLGEEPPTSAIDVFHQSTVLLPAGVWECQYGVQYSLFEDDFLAILPSSAIAPQRTSSRILLGSVSLRYGYNERLQPFLTVPAGVSQVEIANPSSQNTNQEFGASDVTFGANFLLRDGQGTGSDWVLGLTGVAPTGESNFLSVVPGNASLGNGFWIVSPSLSWTRTFDPIVLYSTLSYLHRFEREHLGVPIRPGEEVDLGYGAGFAINDEVTYSLQFLWARQFDTAVDGVAIANSGVDVATIRQSAIVRITPKRFVEVFFSNGLTDSSPRVSLGALLVHRF